jgi:hypothetical protein
MRLVRGIGRDVVLGCTAHIPLRRLGLLGWRLFKQRNAVAERPPTEAARWELTMAIPHWLVGLAIFAGIGSLIAFAFRQGEKVKPDRNKDHDDWTRQTGGGGPHLGH